MAFEHEMAYITAKIDIEPPDAPKSVGTGFFYDAPLNDGTADKIMLLISNRHVFGDPQGKLTISLNRKKEDDMPDFGNTMKFGPLGFEQVYFAHPNPEVDLACIVVTDITLLGAFHKAINDDSLRSINYNEFAAGSNVIFVGYPENRYDVVNNLPLIRRGSIASMPNVDFNGRGQIVIDAQIFPGSSGSPVFVSWGGQYSLLGVVSQTMSRHSQLQTLPANILSVGVEQILGLGIVIKQRHVRELVSYVVEEVVQTSSSS